MNFFTQAFPPSLKDYYDSKVASLETHVFNPANSASTSSATTTFNQYSGIITFNDIEILQSTTVNIALTNSMFAGRMPIFSLLNFSTSVGSIDDIEILNAQTALSGNILIIPLRNNSVSADVTLSVELYFTT